MEQTKLLIFSGRPQPYRKREEVYIDFIPVETYLNTGIWTIEITPRRIANGELRLYMPSAVVRSENTRFLLPSPAQTLTIPSTAQKVITVGAYNAYVRSYAAFSGRGDADSDRAENSKPDLRPGVNIRDRRGRRRGGCERDFLCNAFCDRCRCSFDGIWGLCRVMILFCMEKKSKLIYMREPDNCPVMTYRPNDQVGWGALCVSESLPEK